MTLRGALAVAAALGMLSSPCVAGSRLSVRLVEASNEGTGVSAGLEDVASAMRSSLVFRSYTLVGSRSTPLPAPGSVIRLGPYSVKCSGPQSSLAIRVSKGGRDLLKTTVNLRDDKPLILGGFPSTRGKMILVFLAR